MYSVKKITCLYNLVLLWICLLLADDLITFLKRLFIYFFKGRFYFKNEK